MQPDARQRVNSATDSTAQNGEGVERVDPQSLWRTTAPATLDYMRHERGSIYPNAPRNAEKYLEPILPPIMASTHRKRVALPPLHTLFPATPPARWAPNHIHSSIQTTTESINITRIGHDQFTLSPNGGYIVIPTQPKIQPPPQAPVQVQLEEIYPPPRNVNRKRRREEAEDSRSVDSWSSRIPIHPSEYEGWKDPDAREETATPGASNRQRKRQKKRGKGKGYGYCHYVADDYFLAPKDIWQPPAELKDVMTREQCVKFSERIIDWVERTERERRSTKDLANWEQDNTEAGAAAGGSLRHNNAR